MSNIPKLANFEGKKVVINPDFVNFNEIKSWTPERQMQVFRKMIKENIYKNSNLSEERITKALQAFKSAYELSKYKFQDIERNTGWRYFDHLVRVMQYVIIHSRVPSIKKTLIAICHDLVEDTDVDFNTLRSIFWTHIALWTLLISKEPIKNFIKAWVPRNLNNIEIQKVKKILSEDWKKISSKYLKIRYNLNQYLTEEELLAEVLFIESKSDFEIFEIVKESWILNSKWLISDEYLQRKSYHPESITVDEKWAEELYDILDEKYKNVRNSKYFSHMLSDKKTQYEEKIEENTPCLNKFYNHALSLTASVNLWIKIDKESVKQIILDAIEVKFRDRIDNLRTTEIYTNYNEKNSYKAKRKIQETKEYFYQIAKEFDMLMWTDFFNLIKYEIDKLELLIINNHSLWFIEWIKEHVRNNLSLK